MGKKEGLKGQLRFYGYGLGEFGFTFFLMFIAYQLLYFLTDVLQWPAGPAAVVYTTIQWFEGTTSLLMGIFVEKVSIKRFGKYRPWMVIGAIGCAVFTTLFFVKWSGPLWLQYGLFCLFYLLAYTSYNLMWVAYRSMVGVASMNAKENVSYTSCSAQLGGVMSLIYAAVGTGVLYSFKKMTTAYIVFAIASGALMILGMLVSAMVTKRYDNADTFKRDEASGEKAESISWKQIKVCLSRPMIVYFIGNSLRNSNSVILQSLLIYYFTYVMNKPGLLSVYIIVMSVTTIVGQTPATMLARKFGKTIMYQASAILSVASILAINVIGTNVILFFIIVVFNSFSNIFSGSMIPAYINEIADYTEYEKGVAARSFIVSIGGTATRFASIIGGAFASFGLSIIGYSSNMEVSASFGGSITRLITLSSAICVGLGAIAFLFYPLTDKKMEAIYAKKEARIKEVEAANKVGLYERMGESEEAPAEAEVSNPDDEMGFKVH